jgi:hypothetical protein
VGRPVLVSGWPFLALLMRVLRLILRRAFSAPDGAISMV